MSNRLTSILRWTALSVMLTASPVLHAQTTNAAPAATPAPAAAPAAPAAAAPAAPAANTKDPTEATRIDDLEAYVTNGSRHPDQSDATLNVYKSNLAGIPGPGHNAWMMTSTALVLFMTLPGLALFYGGLVRRKNVLSVLAQCYGITGLVTILWYFIGYSLTFADNTTYNAQGWSILGDAKYFMFNNVTSAPNVALDTWAAHNVFAMFQLTFAIITPALIVGAVAERIKFSAIMIFVGCWMFIVYFPLAHAVWGPDGWMSGLGNAKALIPAIDFAGGTVVHMSSGYSALVLELPD
jgi:Amt family ammonium transporter